MTQSIDTLSYRQYNYPLMMSHKTQLARWLHKILAHNYVNASLMVPYNVSFSALRRDIAACWTADAVTTVCASWKALCKSWSSIGCC